MSFKDLFFASDEESKKGGTNSTPSQGVEKRTTRQHIEMPATLPTEPTTRISVNAVTSVSQVEMDLIRENYRKGIEALNKEGYDFYEFNISVQAAKGNPSDTYSMAFTMGQLMNPSLTVESLIADGEYYIAEIKKAHEEIRGKGQLALDNINSAKTQRRNELNKEMEELRYRINELNRELENKTIEFANLDGELLELIAPINSKMFANDNVMNEVTYEIQTTINNIKTYLK